LSNFIRRSRIHLIFVIILLPPARQAGDASLIFRRALSRCRHDIYIHMYVHERRSDL